jgi:hypothetical protein
MVAQQVRNFDFMITLRSGVLCCGVSLDGGLLGCSAVKSSDCLPTFQSNILPPSSGRLHATRHSNTENHRMYSLSCSQEAALDSLRIQLNPIHTLRFFFFKIHINCLFSSMFRSPKWPGPFIFTKILYAFLISCVLYVSFINLICST